MKLRAIALSLPMSLTLARLCATPLAVWALIEGDFGLAFIVFTLAALSDALDGAVARLLNARTAIGSYLDPIADKLLLMTVFVMLGLQNSIPLWLVILVVFRDVMIIGAVIIFHTAHRPLALSPALISKINSLTQFIYVGLVLAAKAFPQTVMVLGGQHILFGLVMLVAVTTLSSGGVYLSRIFSVVSVNDERK